MKRLTIMIIATATTVAMSAQKLICHTDAATGQVTGMTISTDRLGMNWLLRTDGSQYPWVTEKYAWGNGRMKVDGREYFWLLKNGQAKCGNIVVSLKRKSAGNDIIETYTWRNTSNKTVKLSETGIFTPVNDNYPKSDTCVTLRCNAHIWTGGNTAYICALRMNGEGPHWGMVLTDGELVSYEVFERGQNKGKTNFRGVMAMNILDTELKPGQQTSITWRLFAHKGKADFQQKLLASGGAIVESDYYVAEQGQTVTLTIKEGRKTRTEKHLITKTGDQHIDIAYGRNKRTWVELRCTESIEKLMLNRAGFIIGHQQMMDIRDPRFGAYMVYDNEADTIVTAANRSDLMEGRERLGMGIFLAMLAKKQQEKEETGCNSNTSSTGNNNTGAKLDYPLYAINSSLNLYANFVANLQDKDYTTWSHVARAKKPRGYNYAWVADYWFRMYDLTKERRFAEKGYRTLRALFRRFGHKFYCIDYPLTNGLQALGEAGMTAEADTMLNDFRLLGDEFCKRGLLIPKHEVNYEQSIIAPAVQTLSELYLATGEQKYMDGARAMMDACDAFNYTQPSCYQHDIAIRHWDGYWFGKRQTYGDTYPHYWSAITAATFFYYAKALEKENMTNTEKTQKKNEAKALSDEYMRRAKDIVRNNLVSFDEDGRATCAILRPCRVDGVKAAYRDAYANDQDFALMYYLLINQ